MQLTTTPSQDHAEFDEFCAEVEDFEPLPRVQSAPDALGGEPSEQEQEQRAEPFDEQILAGLVCPY